MFSELYFVNCNGNYSHDFNWDDGAMPSSVEKVTNESALDWAEYISKNPSMGEHIPSGPRHNGYVKAVFVNEHGGSRRIILVISATTKNRALRYARVWCWKNYPAHYEED